jgi:hypothetical protein
MVVNDGILKCVVLTTEISEAQRRMGKAGLLINFDKPTLIAGLKRFVL